MRIHKITNTEFGGYLHRTESPVRSIGVTAEGDFWSNPELYSQSISAYSELIGRVRSVVGDKRLYEIAADVKEGRFFRAQIYQGLGDNFKKTEQRLFQNGAFSMMAGCRELAAEQIEASLCSRRINQVIFFAEPFIAESLFAQDEKIFLDFGKLKEKLISEFSVIVELLDLSYDGNALYFYGIPENDCLKNIENFINKII